MTPPKILDVRTLIPMERHRVIFETYGKLEPGESFVRVNDHDPKPLYYQFEAEHTGDFSWNYRQQGPGTWQVEIGRTAATRRCAPNRALMRTNPKPLVYSCSGCSSAAQMALSGPATALTAPSR